MPFRVYYYIVTLSIFALFINDKTVENEDQKKIYSVKSIFISRKTGVMTQNKGFENGCFVVW